MMHSTATRWAVGLLVASLSLTPAAGRVAKAQPPGEPIGGVGSHGWIDGFGMFTRTAWIGQAPVVQITGITPGAPAARFGLEVGDCIVRVSSYQTTTPRGLADIISRSYGPLRLVVRDVRTGRLVLLVADFNRL